MLRTDIHRPSAIVPADYEFVAYDYIGPGVDPVMMGAERKLRREHMKRTGGHEACHEHGGTCEVCGATAFYVAWFYHAKTNTYIMVGEDCAAKLGMGDAAAFKTFRKVVAARRKAAKGKAVAAKLLTERGLGAAWDIYAAEDRSGFKYEESTIYDIVSKLVRYGSVSDKALNYVKVLLEKIPRRAEIEAKRVADYAAAAPVPVTGERTAVTGKVLSLKVVDSPFGRVTKMLVKSDAGWKVWGTCPAALECGGGDRIEFEAKLERSAKDPKFGFFSRPTKARVLEAVNA